MSTPRGYAVTIAPLAALGQEDQAEWCELERTVGGANPYLGVEWATSWCRRYARADPFVIRVRTNRGELVGLAVMHEEHLGRPPLGYRRLLPVGAGPYSPLELPGHLSAPGHHRAVTRELVGATVAMPTDWSGIALSSEQGWFEPEHLSPLERPRTFWQHTRTRACVVLPLAPTWEEVQRGFKRNLRESLRRTRNRMAKSPADFTTSHRQGADLDPAAMDRFLGLHRARSVNARARVHHPDTYADPRSQVFMREELPELARSRRASLFELHMDGRLVAAQLALHGPGTSYVHSSGFVPEVWDLGPVTHLVAELVRHAVERGDRLVNFSPGPRVSKLRWSEELWLDHEFAYGAGPRSLGARYHAAQVVAATRPRFSDVNWLAD